jgi:hypothetical protein
MKLEFEDFKGWLGSHLDSEVVGYTGSASSCPIARYISSRFGGQWLVGSIQMRPNLDSPLQHMPDWAVEFVNKIDRSGKPRMSDVTAETAYEILRSIKPWKSEYCAAGVA